MNHSTEVHSQVAPGTWRSSTVIHTRAPDSSVDGLTASPHQGGTLVDTETEPTSASYHS